MDTRLPPYCVSCHDHLLSFVDLVNYAIAEGYEPLGPPFREDQMYHQAMLRPPNNRPKCLHCQQRGADLDVDCPVDSEGKHLLAFDTQGLRYT